MKKQKRLILIIAIVLFTAALISAVGLGIGAASIYRNIDFSVDERLFESSRSFESTTFYANSGNSDE